MSLTKQLTVTRVDNEDDRQRALQVLDIVYQNEKDWVESPETLLPAGDLTNPHISWFVASINEIPLGVTRVLYELPIELYRSYAFDLVDESLDVEAFLQHNHIAEVGRFAVVPTYRDRFQVAVALMRATATETVSRGFTHLLTDVFENDPTSPYGFHRRIFGFETVATHEVGELKARGRRVTMLLDLKSAYHRLKRTKRWIFRSLTAGWSEQMIRNMALT